MAKRGLAIHESHSGSAMLATNSWMPKPRFGMTACTGAYSITSPEFGPSVWPTNKDAAGEARNETAAATSSGLP